MPKPPRQSPEYSREREFKVILEDLHGQFKVFGEGQKDLCQRVERIEQKLDGVEQKVDTIEMKVNVIEMKVNVIEIKVNAIEMDVSQMKSFLKPLTAQVSDHDRRLNVLES